MSHRKLFLLALALACPNFSAHGQQPIREIQESAFNTKKGVSCITISADKKLIAVGRPGGPIEVWNLADNSAQCVIEGVAGKERRMQFINDDKELTAVFFTRNDEERHGWVCIWDLKTGMSKQKHKLEDGLATGFSQDGRLIVTSPTKEVSKTAHVWDWMDKKKIVLEADGFFWTTSYICPKNKTIVTFHPKTMRIWDYPSGKIRHQIPLKDEAWALDHVKLSFSADGKLFHFCYPDGYVDIWNAFTGKSVLEKPLFLIRSGTFALFPDGKHLLVDSNRKGAEAGLDVWNIEKRAPVMHLQGTRRSTHQDDIVISTDGRMVARSTSEGTISVWELPTGTVAIQLCEKGGGKKVSGPVYSPYFSNAPDFHTNFKLHAKEKQKRCQDPFPMP